MQDLHALCESHNFQNVEVIRRPIAVHAEAAGLEEAAMPDDVAVIEVEDVAYDEEEEDPKKEPSQPPATVRSIVESPALASNAELAVTIATSLLLSLRM